MTEEKQEEKPSTLSPLDKRMWAAIDELQAVANQIDEEAGAEANAHDRCHIVATLMYSLFDDDMELFYLGGVAECLVEIIDAMKEDEPKQDKPEPVFQSNTSSKGH